MLLKTILYFDEVQEDMKRLFSKMKPEGFQLLYWQDMNPEEREKVLSHADFLLVATAKIDREMILNAKRVKLIQKTGVGVDNIDVKTATRLQIPVANTYGGNATGVAELTLLFILALYRKLPLLNEATKQGKWLMWQWRSSSYEMDGKTHGIVGFGHIGRETAKRSKALGTHIVYYDPYRAPPDVEKRLQAEYLSLAELLKTADIISLHLPLLPETKHLIGLRELQMMKESAILINVSRGGIVDEKALAQALAEGIIAGAGIDVWSSEPVSADHPLLKLDNVIATPHIGAGTRDTLERVLGMAFDNIQKAENGDSIANVVNLQ